MKKIVLSFIFLQWVTGCHPPLNLSSLEPIQIGQSRDTVFHYMRQQPLKVMHTEYNDDHYVAYCYRVKTGTRTSLAYQVGKIQFSKKKPILTPYLFIFKLDPPELVSFGVVETLRKLNHTHYGPLVQQFEVVYGPC